MILKEMAERVARIDKLMQVFLAQKIQEHDQELWKLLLKMDPNSSMQDVLQKHCDCVFCTEVKKLLENGSVTIE